MSGENAKRSTGRERIQQHRSTSQEKPSGNVSAGKPISPSQASDALQQHAPFASSREGGNMAQQTQQKAPAQARKQPKKTDMVFHSIKTVKLVGAVLSDKRVALVRKIAYLGLIAGLLTLVVFPEALGDLVTAVTPFFPLIGIEVPAEGTIDWLVFALATFSLLKIFPREIVDEHYERLFRRKR
jgi:hypothetical protein